MYKNNLHEPEVIRYINSEIKRYDIINYLIERYKLVNYLEIGVFQGENIRLIKLCKNIVMINSLIISNAKKILSGKNEKNLLIKPI